MKTVKEVSAISGVSVRTLHHYDAIGLLKPAQVTEAGYRLYDQDALGRLQTILMLKSLEFPLKDIKEILDAPNFDAVAAMEQQISLLELRRDHLNGLIAHARTIQETGVISMNFKPFDTKKLDTYAAEAKEKWGNTAAYKESEKKNPGQDQADALMAVFAKFGGVRTCDPSCVEAQQLVELLQNTITQNYYNCTKQILSGLGQMYVADDRFRQNIDAAGGEGTAEFAAKAIEIYCK